MSEFNFEMEMSVRYRDLDTMGHVNNAVYATYLEHTRTHYIEEVIGDKPEDANVVLVNLEINYNRSIEFKESVTVAMRATDVGRSSIPMEYEVRADGDVAATASTVLVALDDDGDPRPIPDEIREQIERYEGL